MRIRDDVFKRSIRMWIGSKDLCMAPRRDAHMRLCISRLDLG